MIGQYPGNSVYGATEYNSDMDSFYCYNIENGTGTEVGDECPDSFERILTVGSVKPIFAAADKDGLLRIYDMEKCGAISRIPLPVDRSEIQDIVLCSQDNAIAIWTKSKQLIVYDIGSGTELANVNFEIDTSLEVRLGCKDDIKHNRVYFTNSYNKKYVCISTDTWKVIFSISMDALCIGTNEFYKLTKSVTSSDAREIILHCPAFTLDDLLERVE